MFFVRLRQPEIKVLYLGHARTHDKVFWTILYPLSQSFLYIYRRGAHHKIKNQTYHFSKNFYYDDSSILPKNSIHVTLLSTPETSMSSVKLEIKRRLYLFRISHAIQMIVIQILSTDPK